MSKYLNPEYFITNGPTDPYTMIMTCGHQRRYWFGEDEVGYCTLCEIARLLTAPPKIVISGSSTKIYFEAKEANKDIKP